MKLLIMLGLLAQTQIDLNNQVKPLPSVVVTQLASCTGTPNCAGLQFIQLQQVNGTTQGFWLVPVTSGFTINSNWTSIPVTVAGGSGVSCSQTKP